MDMKWTIRMLLITDKIHITEQCATQADPVLYCWSQQEPAPDSILIGKPRWRHAWVAFELGHRNLELLLVPVRVASPSSTNSIQLLRPRSQARPAQWACCPQRREGSDSTIGWAPNHLRGRDIATTRAGRLIDD